VFFIKQYSDDQIERGEKAGHLNAWGGGGGEGYIILMRKPNGWSGLENRD
jgi:hypothetical protein